MLRQQQNASRRIVRTFWNVEIKEKAKGARRGTTKIIRACKGSSLNSQQKSAKNEEKRRGEPGSFSLRGAMFDLGNNFLQSRPLDIVNHFGFCVTAKALQNQRHDLLVSAKG